MSHLSMVAVPADGPSTRSPQLSNICSITYRLSPTNSIPLAAGFAPFSVCRNRIFGYRAVEVENRGSRWNC